jgi:Ser/Thr protein kinase RdoA (MazF antagonist)
LWVRTADEFCRDDRNARALTSSFRVRIAEAALRILPEALPVGPIHSDFAPRNALVDGDGRVAIIDMLEQWYGCVWEDIAQFLVALETCKPQSLSGGLIISADRIRQLKQAFVNGYFDGETVPWSILALYQAQMVFTKWAAMLHRQSMRTNQLGLLRQGQSKLFARSFARSIEQSLSYVERARTHSTNVQEHLPQLSNRGGWS